MSSPAAPFLNVRNASSNHNTSAIKMYANTGVVIENCEIYNCTVGIFDKGRAVNSVYRSNYIHDCGQAILITDYGWTDVNWATGYYMSNHINCRAYNNVFFNSGGIGVEDQDGSHSSGLEVFNNTFYSSGGTTLNITMGNGTGKVLYNNIFCGTIRDRDLGLIRFGSRNTDSTRVPQVFLEIAACDHNQFSVTASNFLIRVHHRDQEAPNLYTDYSTLADWQESTEIAGGGHPGDGDRNDPDPGFIAADPSQLSDFELAAGSPCKGTGRDGADMGADISLVGPKGAAIAQADNEAPGIPANINAVPDGSNRIDLTWDGSSDNMGTAGYAVYRNGFQIDVVGEPRFTDTDLLAGKTCAYLVVAYDSAGNYSDPCPPVQATTAASGVAQQMPGKIDCPFIRFDRNRLSVRLTDDKNVPVAVTLFDIRGRCIVRCGIPGVNGRPEMNVPLSRLAGQCAVARMTAAHRTYTSVVLK
jgi:hypothetical protein